MKRKFANFSILGQGNHYHLSLCPYADGRAEKEICFGEVVEGWGLRYSTGAVGAGWWGHVERRSLLRNGKRHRRSSHCTSCILSCRSWLYIPYNGCDNIDVSICIQRLLKASTMKMSYVLLAMH